MQNIKYKKKYKKNYNKIVSSNFISCIKLGIFGLKAVTGGVLIAKQLETMRRVISKLTRRNSKIKIRIFFLHPMTKKPLLTRMGKGVGVVKNWVFVRRVLS